MRTVFAIRPLKTVTFFCLLTAPFASGDILSDALRAAVGESTVARSSKIPGAVQERYLSDYGNALAATDEFGIKELFETGKLIILHDTQELLIIELNTAAVTSLREYMKKAVDLRVNGLRACLARNIERAGAGLPRHECAEIDFDAEYAKAYKVFQPDVSPESFMDTHVSVRVRILSGDSTGTAVWTWLKNLKLPTHARSKDPTNQ